MELSIKETIKSSWSLAKRNKWKYNCYMVYAAIISMVLMIESTYDFIGNELLGTWDYIALYVVWVATSAIIVQRSLALVRQEKFESCFSYLKRTSMSYCVMMLIYLLMMLGARSFGHQYYLVFGLFCSPLIDMLKIIILDKGQSILEALDTLLSLLKGNFAFFMVASLLAGLLTGALSFTVVGAAWGIPFIFTAYSLMYIKLLEEKHLAAQ